MTDVAMIEGIGESYKNKLSELGITTTEALLEAGASTSGRAELEKGGIAASLILRWVNHADLFRVDGIGKQYAELLEAAGVDSVPELSQRNAENLLQRLIEANEQKELVRQVPSLTQVKSWIENAKQLKRVITY